MAEISRIQLGHWYEPALCVPEDGRASKRDLSLRDVTTGVDVAGAQRGGTEIVDLIRLL